jgi:hypothetical protein
MGTEAARHFNTWEEKQISGAGNRRSYCLINEVQTNNRSKYGDIYSVWSVYLISIDNGRQNEVSCFA